MSLSPYLFFDGTCRAAMTAYAEILGGEILAMMSYAEAPPEEGLGDVPADHIMHAALRLGGDMLMASDDMPGRHVAPAATHVMVTLPDLDTARTAFDRLAEGGEVRMPFQPTFWTAGFGSLQDRWGQLWMIGVDDQPEGD